MLVTYYRFEVFSEEPDKGNPAAVVLGDDLTTEEMQLIAKKIGFSETIYLLPSERATLRLRYFSPHSEMPLCGHGTLAAVTCWSQMIQTEPLNEIVVETNSECLTIKLEQLTHQLLLTMAQLPPKFHSFNGEKRGLARCLGIDSTDISEEWPIIYGNTGSWTLIVPVKGLGVMKKMQPINQAFPNVLQEFPQASIHPICLETYHAESRLHGRHFSGAGTGTVEDPVTGTASGVMGAYYCTFIEPSVSLPLTFQIEQGQEMGKDGSLEVRVSRQNQALQVAIKGQALFVSKELLKL